MLRVYKELIKSTHNKFGSLSLRAAKGFLYTVLMKVDIHPPLRFKTTVRFPRSVTKFIFSPAFDLIAENVRRGKAGSYFRKFKYF
jgi:hypothetical protein